MFVVVAGEWAFVSGVECCWLKDEKRVDWLAKQ